MGPAVGYGDTPKCPGFYSAPKPSNSAAPSRLKESRKKKKGKKN